MEKEKKRLHEDIEKRREEYTTTGKSLVEKFAKKSRAEIKAKLIEANIPTQIIQELLPADEKKPEANKK